MSVVVVTPFPIPGHRAGVIAACDHLGSRRTGLVRLYPLHERLGRLVMIEKYESEQVRSEHLKGAALARLRSVLDGRTMMPFGGRTMRIRPAAARVSA